MMQRGNFTAATDSTGGAAEEMIVTMKAVAEEERIRWQIQQREDYGL